MNALDGYRHGDGGGKGDERARGEAPSAQIPLTRTEFEALRQRRDA